MGYLPKIKNVKFVNVHDEEVEAKIIPLSIKASNDVEDSLQGLRTKLREARPEAIRSAKDTMNINDQTEKELQDAYVDAKITMDLAMHGGDISDDRLKSQRTKRKTKLLEGKTKEDLLEELPIMFVDMKEKTEIVTYTVARTLWNTLRKADNTREKVFEKPETLIDELAQVDMYDIFNEHNDETKLEEEDVKNLQSPTS